MCEKHQQKFTFQIFFFWKKIFIHFLLDVFRILFNNDSQQMPFNYANNGSETRLLARTHAQQQGAFRARYHIYSSKRHIRPLRTILFGGLGLGLSVGVLGSVHHNFYPHPNPNNNPNTNTTLTLTLTPN